MIPLSLAAIDLSNASWFAPLLAEGPPELFHLFKVEAYMWLVLLMVVMLLLFVFNRLMATWARQAGHTGTKHRDSYYADDGDWANDSGWSLNSLFQWGDDSSDDSGGDWDSSDDD